MFTASVIPVTACGPEFDGPTPQSRSFVLNGVSENLAGSNREILASLLYAYEYAVVLPVAESAMSRKGM